MTRTDIDSAMQAMNSRIGAKRELKALEDELSNDEAVQHLAGGTYQDRNGLIALTDKRVLFFHRGFLKSTTEDFPLAKITSVQHESGMLMSKITVAVSSREVEIKNVEKVDAKRMVAAIRDAI